jgi:hypothetical protein
MKLSQPQLHISESSARFRVVVAGRRFGKTYLSMNEMARVARYPNRNVWYVAPTYRMCRQIIWEPLKTRLRELNWIKKTNETDLTLTLRNGSKISLRGADNPDGLRGVSLDLVAFDEFSYIDEKAWTEVIRPTLSDRGGSALFITTPSGTNNWAYDLYQRGLDPTEHQWESFQYTTLDGGNVTAEEVEQARRDLDERTFRQEYLATFENYVGRIFYSFDRGTNVKKWEQPVPDVIYIGLDFNVGMMSASVFAQQGEIVHAFDEIALYSSNTTEMVEEIRSRYPTQKIFVYPDPAGSARKTSASGSTDHTILANAGFIVKAPYAHNPVRDGINAVNSRLRDAQGRPRLFIDPSCKKIIESMEKHCYKEGTSIPDKDSGFDHFSDSMRYYIDYVFPIRRETDTSSQPKRFTHRTGANR